MAMMSRLAAVALLTGCAAIGPTNPVGIEVVGEGSELRFGWSADHPWAGRFANQPSQYRLFAQYIADGKRLEQEIAVARPTSKTSWTFTLPAELRAVPSTEVCLLVAQSRGGQVIPVRAGRSRADGDTARFRFPGWEASVKAQSAKAHQGRSYGQAEASLKQEEERVAALTRALAARGITSKQSCESLLTRPASLATALGFDLEGIPDVAARVCVRRTRNLRRLPTSVQMDVPALAVDVLNDQGLERSDPLRVSANAFLKDWNRWQASTGASYTPEVGDADDLLPVGGILAQQIGSVRKAEAPANAATKRILLTGLLSTYSGCLEDSQKQLKVKVAAWEQERVNKPLRDKRYAEQLYKTCLNDVEEVDQALKAMAVARATLSHQKDGAGASEPAIIGAARASVLTDESCTL